MEVRWRRMEEEAASSTSSLRMMEGFIISNGGDLTH
jgi:hypothetical protein